MSHGVYWTNPRFTDRRRWRVEYRKLMAACGAGSNASIIACVMWENADPGTRDNARLILADIAEENGFEYLSMFLRKKMTCIKPRKRRRR